MFANHHRPKVALWRTLVVPEVPEKSVKGAFSHYQSLIARHGLTKVESFGVTQAI
jgi:hypothetical protein